jgi:hypothetical protein
MRTKNKMKESEGEFEEWWEVVEEYFAKETLQFIPTSYS